MTQEMLRMQMLSGIITESQYVAKLKEIEGDPEDHYGYQEPVDPNDYAESNGDIKQDILDFWGTQQDDAAQSDGEYEAEWDTEFFTNEYPEYKGREEEINTLVKTLKIK